MCRCFRRFCRKRRLSDAQSGRDALLPFVDVEDRDEPEVVSSARLTDRDDEDDLSRSQLVPDSFDARAVTPRPQRVLAEFFGAFVQIWRVVLLYITGASARHGTARDVQSGSRTGGQDLEEPLNARSDDTDGFHDVDLEALSVFDEDLLHAVDSDVKALLAVDLNDATWSQDKSYPIDMFAKDVVNGVFGTAGRAMIPHSPEIILEALILPQSDPLTTSMRPAVESDDIVRRVNRTTSIHHLVYKKIFGVAKRDLCLRIHHRSIPDGGYVMSASSADEVESSHVRMTCSPPSGWIMRPVGDETEVTFVSHIHFGGSLPKFATLQTAKDTSMQVYRLLLELVKNPPKRTSATAPRSHAPTFDSDFLVLNAESSSAAPRCLDPDAVEMAQQCDADVNALLSVDTANTAAWSKATSHPIDIYRSKCESLRTIGQTVAPFAAETVLKTLLLPADHATSQAVHPQVATASNIRQIDDSTFISHVVYKKVAPMTKRDMVLRVHHRPIEGGFVCTSVSCEGVPDAGYRRCRMLRPSGWILRSRGENETQITFVSCMDFDGPLPAFMVNQLAKDTPMQVHRLVQEMKKASRI
eukprot:GEMP01009160.1.p1 GENE.GEMP01009160.1~~GEMP01009160.1.p1  ORF type:complete len:584 (+),score=151.22 GEMP01009160.1:109-1860(+)